MRTRLSAFAKRACFAAVATVAMVYSSVSCQAALPDVGVDLSALTTDITTYITTGLLAIVALGIVVRLVFKMARKATSAI